MIGRFISVQVFPLKKGLENLSTEDSKNLASRPQRVEAKMQILFTCLAMNFPQHVYEN